MNKNFKAALLFLSDKQVDRYNNLLTRSKYHLAYAKFCYGEVGPHMGLSLPYTNPYKFKVLREWMLGLRASIIMETFSQEKIIEQSLRDFYYRSYYSIYCLASSVILGSLRKDCNKHKMAPDLLEEIQNTYPSDDELGVLCMSTSSLLGELVTLRESADYRFSQKTMSVLSSGSTLETYMEQLSDLYERWGL